jgi:alkanesulfonate monooxygenase SsuD/methylene tetrahydromethanopterin reductase-like flavin-dependent oxidoreductase (luciferase family)
VSGRLEIGLVLPLLEAPPTGDKPSWDTITNMAQTAEELGFDTVWVADELLWRVPDWSGPRGWWECVAMAGAVAATTSTIGVGTWVLSALHRKPGLTVKIAETLDEISGGRFLFGLGAGHSGNQGATFGYPADRTVSRYEEALAIIVPALRGEIVSRDGDYHRVSELDIRPRGPRPGQIPLMLGAHGPRTMRLAARHADIWSAFATESSLPDWFEPMLRRLEEACAAVDRDPQTLGRSVGVFVEPGDADGTQSAGLGVPISGSPAEIAGTISRFADIGVTRVELMLWPNTEESLAAVALVMELLRA